MNSSINFICCYWRRDYEIINENDVIDAIDVTAIEIGSPVYALAFYFFNTRFGVYALAN